MPPLDIRINRQKSWQQVVRAWHDSVGDIGNLDNYLCAIIECSCCCCCCNRFQHSASTPSRKTRASAAKVLQNVRHAVDEFCDVTFKLKHSKLINELVWQRCQTRYICQVIADTTLALNISIAATTPTPIGVAHCCAALLLLLFTQAFLFAVLPQFIRH